MSRYYEAITLAGETLTPELQQSTPRTAHVLPSSEDRIPEWLLVLSTLRKHWRISTLFAAIVMVAVTIVTFSIKAIYQPSGRIEVDPPGETFSLSGGGAGGSDAEYLETQAKNLKSDKLAIAVIRKLNLDKNPDLVHNFPDASANKAIEADSSLDVVQLTLAENEALGTFRERLEIQRDTASRLITVSFASHDPKLAALVTNNLIDTFIEQTYQEQHDAIAKSTEWLGKQLDDIRVRMENANRVLAQFQESIGLADIDTNKSTFTEQMAELSRQLAQARADRIRLEAMLVSTSSGNPDSLPDVRNHPVVQRLSEQLAQKRAELSQTMVLYGKNHPTAKRLQTEVDELTTQLDNQKNAILRSVRGDFDAANARERLVSSQMKGTSTELNQMARYNALRKEAEANSALYNSLYARVKEAGIAAASRSSNLRIVDEARVLIFPSRPNRLLNLVIGFFAALLGGVLIALLREQIDTRIFTPEDVRRSIGRSSISVVPLVTAPKVQELANGTQSGEVGLIRKNPGNGAVHFLLQRPHSPEAEALHALYTSIMLSRTGNAPQVVLVVSSYPGEGKTTVAANLATAMARHGRTCIVDADLRRGRIADAFGITAEVGLSEVLTGAAPVGRALVNAPGIANLVVLPSHAGSLDAGQLMCSNSIDDIIQDLRRSFRFVVLDSPPLIPFADGRALATRVDGLVFVGRSGTTTRQVLRRSMELLNEVHASPILEFVLNGADLNSSSYDYYRNGYDSYHKDDLKQSA